MSSPVRIVEVGPRDGLQNEPTPIPIAAKVEFVAALVAAGLHEIEATSFVSPKWVPQLGDAAELWPMLPNGPLYSALVPNMKGLQAALDVGCDRIALFTAASDDFTQKNINMSIDESIAGFRQVVEAFRAARPGAWVRGYVSTAFECPYAGRIDPSKTARVVERLIELGVDEVSIGDTVGTASPREVRSVAKLLTGFAPPDKLAYHFHDTHGTAIANVAEALEQGASIFDSSAAGLGGCPYSPGAGGNLSTDDLIYFLAREGVETGIDPAALAQASLPILELLGKAPFAKAQQAVLAATR